MKNFEEMMANAIKEAYITTYGSAKWEALTDEEKNMVLHLVLNDFAKAIL